MNTTDFVKCGGALLAVAICSACGGGTAIAPQNAALKTGYTGYIGKMLTVNGRLVTAARANLSGLARFAAVIPDPPAIVGSRAHEYIINDYGSYASIFRYPKTDRQVGTIGNVGGQGCTNVLYGYGKGTFWIIAGPDQITEYEVPKTPIKTLSIAPSTDEPSSCAMDAAGDLAVGNLSNGDIIIFKNASGSGTVMATPLMAEFFDGYDPHGNLFFDGFNHKGVFEFDELPKGSTKFKTLTTSNTVQFPGSVQWDGRYVVVTDQVANKMYRYTINRAKATLKGTVTLTGSSDCAQTWIAKGIVFCADAHNEDGEVFKYPAGGSPIAVLGANLPLPLGTVAATK